MVFQDEEARLAEFERSHGPCMFEGLWGVTADGCEIECSDLGYRAICDQSPERKRDIKLRYWRLLVERTTKAFDDFHITCREKEHVGLLSESDTDKLRKLKSQAEQAQEQLHLLENPPLPDAREVRHAKGLYRKRQLATATAHDAEQAYHEAKAKSKGRETENVTRLADTWWDRYNEWETLNLRYQQIDEDVRKQAEQEVIEEQAAARRAAISLELNDIEN